MSSNVYQFQCEDCCKDTHVWPSTRYVPGQFPGGISPRDISTLLAEGGENMGRRLLSTRGFIRPRFARLRDRRSASSDDDEDITGDVTAGGRVTHGFMSRGREEGAPVLVAAGVIKQPMPVLPKGAALAPKDQHGLWAARLAALYEPRTLQFKTSQICFSLFWELSWCWWQLGLSQILCPSRRKERHWCPRISMASGLRALRLCTNPAPCKSRLSGVSPPPFSFGLGNLTMVGKFLTTQFRP